MAMIAQLYLFGGGPVDRPVRKGIVALPLPTAPLRQPSPPPVATRVNPIPAPPSAEWARRLNASGVGDQVTIHLSTLWTGVVLEVLCQGATGRWTIDREKVVTEIPADPGAVGRIIYVTATQAAEMHAQWPLVLLGAPGTHSARYRLAVADEAAGGPLTLPTAPMEPEAAP